MSLNEKKNRINTYKSLIHGLFSAKELLNTNLFTLKKVYPMETPLETMNSIDSKQHSSLLNSTFNSSLGIPSGIELPSKETIHFFNTNYSNELRNLNNSRDFKDYNESFNLKYNNKWIENSMDEFDNSNLLKKQLINQNRLKRLNKYNGINRLNRLDKNDKVDRLNRFERIDSDNINYDLKMDSDDLTSSNENSSIFSTENTSFSSQCSSIGKEIENEYKFKNEYKIENEFIYNNQMNNNIICHTINSYPFSIHTLDNLQINHVVEDECLPQVGIIYMLKSFNDFQFIIHGGNGSRNFTCQLSDSLLEFTIQLENCCQMVHATKCNRMQLNYYMIDSLHSFQDHCPPHQQHTVLDLNPDLDSNSEQNSSQMSVLIPLSFKLSNIFQYRNSFYLRIGFKTLDGEDCSAILPFVKKLLL